MVQQIEGVAAVRLVRLVLRGDEGGSQLEALLEDELRQQFVAAVAGAVRVLLEVLQVLAAQ
ncbi:MAG: hypothetical protein WCC36_00415 [Gammaproteobacteria bacterium]